MDEEPLEIFTQLRNNCVLRLSNSSFNGTLADGESSGSLPHESNAFLFVVSSPSRQPPHTWSREEEVAASTVASKREGCGFVWRRPVSMSTRVPSRSPHSPNQRFKSLELVLRLHHIQRLHSISVFTFFYSCLCFGCCDVMDSVQACPASSFYFFVSN